MLESWDVSDTSEIMDKTESRQIQVMNSKWVTDVMMKVLGIHITDIGLYYTAVGNTLSSDSSLMTTLRLHHSRISSHLYKLEQLRNNSGNGP